MAAKRHATPRSQNKGRVTPAAICALPDGVRLSIPSLRPGDQGDESNKVVAGPPHIQGINIMRRKITLAVAALAVLSLAGTANAYSFTPTNTTFAATGTLMLTAAGAAVNCNTNLGGKTSAKGGASITSAVFSGSSPVCKLITPTGLPWKTTAKSATKAIIANVAVSGGGGSCGPTKVNITVSPGGAFTFHNAKLSGGCVIDGTLQTAPVITITNP